MIDPNKLEELCDLAKKMCNITWSDNDTDKKIREITENAIYSLHHRLGMGGDVSIDNFLNPGMTKTLFLKYILYDWNEMLDEFELNYRKEIIAERHRYEVENAKNTSENVQ